MSVLLLLRASSDSPMCVSHRTATKKCLSTFGRFYVARCAAVVDSQLCHIRSTSGKVALAAMCAKCGPPIANWFTFTACSAHIGTTPKLTASMPACSASTQHQQCFRLAYQDTSLWVG